MALKPGLHDFLYNLLKTFLILTPTDDWFYPLSIKLLLSSYFPLIEFSKEVVYVFIIVYINCILPAVSTGNGLPKSLILY